MKFFRYILFPFAYLYKIITSIRNFLYDQNVLSSTSFTTPVIAVGNLAVGGTGKTPQIEYLVNLLQPKYNIAILSRGYKRTTKGFIKADATANAQTIGDEPFQYFSKFKDVTVCVDANRTRGITQILKDKNPPNVILLDDAFQHRKVTAKLYILLTSYQNLYVDDVMLPTGNLRESKNGAKRAKIIIVTKCPPHLSEKEQAEMVKNLRIEPYQKVFFSTIQYAKMLKGKKEIPFNTLKNTPFTLVTGIANPLPLLQHIKEQQMEFTHLKFPDHHHFSKEDIQKIQNTKKIVLTTEKDYMRLQGKIENLYYIPITTNFVKNKQQFDNLIFKYVE